MEQMDDYYREFGARVRNARGERSQADLAAASGMSRAAVANIELGRNRVTLDVLDRLARALGTDPCTLLPVTTAPSGLRASALLPGDRAAIERVRARAGLNRSGDDAEG